MNEKNMNENKETKMHATKVDKLKAWAPFCLEVEHKEKEGQPFEKIKMDTLPRKAKEFLAYGVDPNWINADNAEYFKKRFKPVNYIDCIKVEDQGIFLNAGNEKNMKKLLELYEYFITEVYKDMYDYNESAQHNEKDSVEVHQKHTQEIWRKHSKMILRAVKHNHNFVMFIAWMTAAALDNPFIISEYNRISEVFQETSDDYNEYSGIYKKLEEREQSAKSVRDELEEIKKKEMETGQNIAIDLFDHGSFAVSKTLQFKLDKDPMWAKYIDYVTGYRIVPYQLVKKTQEIPETERVDYLTKEAQHHHVEYFLYNGEVYKFVRVDVIRTIAVRISDFQSINQVIANKWKNEGKSFTAYEIGAYMKTQPVIPLVLIEEEKGKENGV